MEITGDEAAYLMGDVEPAKSSVLTSNSRYLNNPRMRDIFAQMGLKRNGRDLPDAYLVPELNRALAEETDTSEIHALIAAERERLPEFAEWLETRFVSAWSEKSVANCAAGTVGAAIGTFITQSGMDIDFMFRGEPADDYAYLIKRRVQNHDIEHMVTGFDPSAVGEIALIVANAVAVSNYFSPALAQQFNLQPMLLASTSLMRTACHYPTVTPALLEGFARGEALGRRQTRPLFMIRWEDWIDTPMDEARAALGFEDCPPADHWTWTSEAAKG